VRGNQRGVDVDHDPVRPNACLPGGLACPRTRRAQRREQVRIGSDRVDHTKRRRVGGDRPEQRALVANRAQIREAVATVGEHHRQVAHHAARIVPAAPLADRRERSRQRISQPEPIGRLGQQRRTGVRDQSVSVRRHIYGQPAPIALHPQGDPPEPGLRALTTRRIPAQADSPAAPTIGAAATS
jgi:hypothetical protein